MKAQFPTIEGLHEKDILSAYAIKCLTGKGVGWIVKVCIFGGCFQTALFYFNFHEEVEKGFYIFSNTGCVFWRTSKNADFFFLLLEKSVKIQRKTCCSAWFHLFAATALTLTAPAKTLKVLQKLPPHAIFAPRNLKPTLNWSNWFFGLCGLWRLDVSSMKFLFAMLLYQQKSLNENIRHYDKVF